METVLRAPFRARLRECPVAVGSLVETGAPLLRLEPLGNGGSAGAAPDTADVELDLPAEPAGRPGPRAGHGRAARPARAAARLRRRPRRRAPGAGRLPGGAVGGRPARWTAGQHGASWRDRAARGVRRPVRADPEPPGRPGRRRTDSQVHSPREYFHTYLQSLDAERAGLPEAFQHRLSQVLRHYGVDGSLERTPGAGGRGLPDLPGAAPRRPADAAVVSRATAAVADRAAAGRAAARAGRPDPGTPDRGDPAAFPRGRRPGPLGRLPLVRPAAAAPQPGPGLRGRAQAPRYLDTTPGRAGPRRTGSPRWWPARSRWCGCSGSGSAARARGWRRCWRC